MLDVNKMSDNELYEWNRYCECERHNPHPCRDCKYYEDDCGACADKVEEMRLHMQLIAT